MKIQKNIGSGGGVWGGGSGWGVRVDVNEELRFLGKFTKKNWGGGGGLVAEGVRCGGGGRVGGGVRVDVNAMLGEGYGGCEPRMYKCTKRYCTIL